LQTVESVENEFSIRFFLLATSSEGKKISNETEATRASKTARPGGTYTKVRPLSAPPTAFGPVIAFLNSVMNTLE
jgi:hypothetical protein